jgi:hypothetical protein
MRILFLLFFGLILWTSNTNAQSKINFFEANVAFMRPTGFLNRNIQNTKVGFEAGYLRQLKLEKPLFWGLSIYYHPINSATATIQEVLDFDLVNFDYQTTSNLLGFNGKMRFYPDLNLGKLELYVEAQLGYKWFFTSTSKTLTNDQEASDSSIEKGSLSLTYGASGGINFPVNGQLYLNFRANYLPGLSTSYYVRNDSNTLSFSTIELFDLKKSTTDIIRWDLGVTWKLPNSDDE